MSAQVTISQLPTAGAITGTELVPVVQNGVTVQTTTAALAGSPVQTYTYLTVSQTPQLANSRYVGATNGLVITDGGAQGLFNISTTGVLLSLVNSGTGFQVKTSGTAVTPRSIAVSNSGLSITNGSGVSGDPTITLTGQALNFANASFNGLVVLSTGGAITSATITGTSSQIDVANGTGVSGNPTLSLATDPVLPGTGGVVVPTGTTGQRGTSTLGNFRFNSTTGLFEGYNGAWNSFAAGSGVTSVATGTGLTGGPITSTGTISIDSTVATLTDTQTLTNKTISGASNTLSNIANASLSNSTISGVALGSNLFNLTAGTGVSFSSGTTYNGSAAITINSTGLGGTVTSVAQSFTGGLISVAGSPITSSGTLALTVAGTSGGVPYFTSGTTWATSAALAASALVVGGGAGAAPSTITTGTGVVTALGVNTGSAGAFVVNGGALGTPSSGTVTNLTGTASININGTVGATTANTGSFTSLAYTTTLTGGTGIVNLGSGQFCKDASGNVGIGTTSPSTWGKFAVVATSAAGTVVSAIVNGSGVAGSQSVLSFDPGANGFNVRDSQIRATNNGGNAVTLEFYTANGATPLEAMRITPSGNVGIGTASPTTKLDVSGTINATQYTGISGGTF